MTLITESTLTAHVTQSIKKSNVFSVLKPISFNQENVDYVVTGIVEDAHIHTKIQRNPDTHTLQSYKMGNIQMQVNVADTRTGKIIATIPILIHKQFLINEQHPLSDTAIESVLTEAAANTISASILDAIFPPRVMQIDGNVIYVYRGNGSNFAIGDRLTIHAPANPGAPLGTATVTEINARYTLATVSTGDPRTFAETWVTKTTPPPVTAVAL